MQEQPESTTPVSDALERTSDGDHADYPTMREFLAWEEAQKGEG